MSDYTRGGNCPRCRKDYEEFPALSRVDNKTYICSACGVAEAMWNFFGNRTPLTPPTEPVNS